MPTFRQFFNRKLKWENIVNTITYAFIETFDNATDYDNAGWTTFAGTPLPNYTTAPAPLEGTQSLKLATGAVISRTLANSSTWNGYFQLNITTWQSFSALIYGQDSTFADAFIINMWNSGPNHISAQAGSGAAVEGTFALSTGVTYHIWWEWTLGTGANAIMKVYISTTATKPGSPDISVTNGNATLSPNKIRMSSAGSGDCIMDRLILDPTQVIQSNP